MKDVLARANREILEQFASSNVLVAFDYDGTLAPIVRDPARAAMRHATRRLLDRVAALYPCIVVSERARATPDAGSAESRFAGLSAITGSSLGGRIGASSGR